MHAAVYVFTYASLCASIYVLPVHAFGCLLGISNIVYLKRALDLTPGFYHRVSQVSKWQLHPSNTSSQTLKRHHNSYLNLTPPNTIHLLSDNFKYIQSDKFLPSRLLTLLNLSSTSALSTFSISLT